MNGGNHALWQFSCHLQLIFSSTANTRVNLQSRAETFSALVPSVQVNLLLSPLQLLISTTTSAAMLLWFQIVNTRSASYPPLSYLRQFDATLSTLISKALPVVSVRFSSLGVWSILSSPRNSSEASASSTLKTRTVPLGRAMPILLSSLLEIYSLLLAFRFFSVQPPAAIVMKLYLRTSMPKTLGMNSTCFQDFYSRVTVQLKVYIWKSEKDFSEKEGAALPEAISDIISISGTAFLYTLRLLTKLTSPAINFNLASSYFLPLQLSMVTQPPISALVSLPSKVIEQSAFQLKPVVLQETQQSVVVAFLLETFQLSVGRVWKPAGREGKLMPLTSVQTSIPESVLRMQPSLQPRSVPLTRVEVVPITAWISISLLMYFLRMELVLMRLASQFCSKTVMSSGVLMALKLTVSVCILDETSVKQRLLLPWSKEMDLTSLTIAN